jgi:hypothetical protein
MTHISNESGRNSPARIMGLKYIMDFAAPVLRFYVVDMIQNRKKQQILLPWLNADDRRRSGWRQRQLPAVPGDTNDVSSRAGSVRIV